MTDTFTWKVHATASGGGDFMVAEAKLGDGYIQSVPLGLNPDVQKWSVTVSDYRAALLAGPLAFLRAHPGVAFYWTPPLGVQGKYRCKSYKPTNQGGGYWTLAMEFEQGYSP